jgi:hypothetical protein
MGRFFFFACWEDREFAVGVLDLMPRRVGRSYVS